METKLTKTLHDAIAGSLNLPLDAVRCTWDGDTVVITVTGELLGHSVRYAARRRQRAHRLARRIAANDNYKVSIAFVLEDAFTRLQQLIETTTELVMGRPADVVDVAITSNGGASVLIALSGTEEAGKALADTIIPLLRKSGLDPVTVSIVAPPDKTVSDGRILRATKLLAPCDSADVARHFREKDGVTVDSDFIHRRLDRLRQRGLLAYLGDRKFALSVKGVTSVPTTNRRDSSDIERILAIARRSW